MFKRLVGIPNLLVAIMNGQELYTQVFQRPRNLRSDAYKLGVLAMLEYLCEGKELKCPYKLGSAEFDAYTAGTDEGHTIHRNMNLQAL